MAPQTAMFPIANNSVKKLFTCGPLSPVLHYGPQSPALDPPLNGESFFSRKMLVRVCGGSGAVELNFFEGPRILNFRENLFNLRQWRGMSWGPYKIEYLFKMMITLCSDNIT